MDAVLTGQSWLLLLQNSFWKTCVRLTVSPNFDNSFSASKRTSSNPCGNAELWIFDHRSFRRSIPWPISHEQLSSWEGSSLKTRPTKKSKEQKQKNMKKNKTMNVVDTRALALDVPYSDLLFPFIDSIYLPGISTLPISFLVFILLIYTSLTSICPVRG